MKHIKDWGNGHAQQTEGIFYKVYVKNGCQLVTTLDDLVISHQITSKVTCTVDFPNIVEVEAFVYSERYWKSNDSKMIEYKDYTPYLNGEKMPGILSSHVFKGMNAPDRIFFEAKCILVNSVIP